MRRRTAIVGAACGDSQAWVIADGDAHALTDDRACEKTFVDYSGHKPHFIDPLTSAKVEVELFVAVLGASNLTFATTTLTQRMHDFVASHVKAFAYFGGVTRATVPDQLKSAVVVSSRYEKCRAVPLGVGVSSAHDFAPHSEHLKPRKSELAGPTPLDARDDRLPNARSSLASR